MIAHRIDLNSDVGESFGNYKLGLDEEVIPMISSANIACGFHAGDPTVLRRTVALARDHKVAVGAHPGLPDLMGFGRRAMDVTPSEIKDYITYQVGAIQAFAAAEGVQVQHVKPHGALYNMAVQNPDIWETVAGVLSELDKNLILFVLGGANKNELSAMADQYGIRVAFEFFADRAYNPDGSLVSRTTPGAVIKDHDQAAQRVLKMSTEGKVTCVDGSEIDLPADTICVHGDNPAALQLVKKIRQTLTEAGVDIRAPQTFL